jgi:ABC-type antimicrobial peptide transport system permease subunit
MTMDFNLMGRVTFSIRPALDPAALGVAALALLLSMAVFGLEPAIALARSVNISGVMAAGTSRARTRRQRMVVRWQVAVAAGFFIVATMFVRGTIEQARHDSGVEMDRIAVASLNMQGPLWSEARVRHTVDRVLEEGRQDPVLESIAASTGLPFGVGLGALPLTLARPAEAGRDAGTPMRATGLATTPSIFQTLGVRVLRGRAFDDRDHAAAAPVAVVSEFTARQLFGTGEAVGREVIVHRGSRPMTAAIVGVARDTDVRAILADPSPLVYLPLAQHEHASLTIVARSSDAARALPALREALRRADPDLPVDAIGTGRTMLSGIYEVLRSGGKGALYLGLMTLLLAMAGLFGVQSHLIVHRTREIGVRMSMGATARQIKAMVLLDGYRPVLEGLVLGLWGGFAGRILVRAYLELEVGVVDPWMLAVTPIPIVLAAFCACYLPAQRAAAVDPTVALRCE